MGAPIMHQGALVFCMHGGPAQPIPPLTNPRVKVNGMNVVTRVCSYTISGCTLPPPPAGNGPCATANWLTAATRVKAGGMPLVLQSSVAACVPTGTGLLITSVQPRVTAL